MLVRLDQDPEFLRLAAQYEAEVANLKLRPMDAEIVPNSMPHWYVIVTQSGHDKIAAGHLAGRRFGVYVPEFEVTEIRRGRKVEVARLLFPGYIFAFIWGIDRHRERIRACTGVKDVLLHPDGTPAIISDEVIAEVMKLENERRPLKVMIVEQVTENTKKNGKKKRYRKTKKPIEADDRRNDIIAVRAFSPFRDIEKLDDSGRNGVLMRALGLAS